MIIVTASSYIEQSAAGGGLSGSLPPIEEDVYFRHIFTSSVVPDEVSGGGEGGGEIPTSTEVISNTYISSIEVVTAGFPNANLSLIHLSANAPYQASANGYISGVFDKFFWRYHYALENSANNAFHSDLVGFDEANTATFIEIPPVEDKPIVYWANPDLRRECTIQFNVRVEYSGGLGGGSYEDFPFTEVIVNNWDTFRRKLIQLRTDGRLGPYTAGNTYDYVEYDYWELDPVLTLNEFGDIEVVHV